MIDPFGVSKTVAGKLGRAAFLLGYDDGADQERLNPRLMSQVVAVVGIVPGRKGHEGALMRAYLAGYEFAQAEEDEGA